jgi:hypothetical protein
MSALGAPCLGDHRVLFRLAHQQRSNKVVASVGNTGNIVTMVVPLVCQGWGFARAEIGD